MNRVVLPGPAGKILTRIRSLLRTEVYFGRYPENLPENSIVFFPYEQFRLACGLAGLISFRRKKDPRDKFSLDTLEKAVKGIECSCFNSLDGDDRNCVEKYFGGGDNVACLLESARSLKEDSSFTSIFMDKKLQNAIRDLLARIQSIIESESAVLERSAAVLSKSEVEIMASRVETMKDTAWCLEKEILGNIIQVGALLGRIKDTTSLQAILIYKKLNSVLNSIDRLEVRGRDSAGVSLMFVVSSEEHQKLEEKIKAKNLGAELESRLNREALLNKSISIRESTDEAGNTNIAITMVYKIAAEIGSLGDNVRFLRDQIREDAIFQAVSSTTMERNSLVAHTRWASVGEISETNCHPVDNCGREIGKARPIIHVCLNGDIDNYLSLKDAYEKEKGPNHAEIGSDTKIIPLWIERYLEDGHDIEEAFRLAVNDFKGSHAISMHSDLAPGKLFIAQKGSGQSVFIGIAGDHYMPTSEVYGFVEETQFFIKMDGETAVEGINGRTQGQIFILDQQSPGGLEGIKAVYYDGTLIELNSDDIKHTEITSRDIDRQDFPHYFLKEISESPVSVEKTLRNRWKVRPGSEGQFKVFLGESNVSAKIKDALESGQIKRVYFVGQGTAGVAALACAGILDYYMDDPSIFISALKASELSGFKLGDSRGSGMEDTLVIAISQSGTTTDTNRTIDMVRERGGHTLAIVNRRDSDITFKVDGVVYTSSGRDIEMSVASTKAFYSQIVAGAILSLFLAEIMNRRSPEFITNEINELISLPSKMRKILEMRDVIEESARRTAVSKTYWAAVGSGPNKASADEIRIKLSELCYKTISTDYVEDKKHIDLSSEPLIIVCAAGTRGSVLGDIIKDTAIFKAHKATPIVIVDEGEERFAPYTRDVFHVPKVPEHLAPIVNTLVGHIWGYYAALSINKGSRLLFSAREEIRKSLDDYFDNGLDIYEVILEKGFREKIASFYNLFRKNNAEKSFSSITGATVVSDLILLLKYLAGRLPVSDFELDFGIKGTAKNMVDRFFKSMASAINSMARPVDAIKHQAKTVTVGTSRITERIGGIVFDCIESYGLGVSQLTNTNVLVLRNLQTVVDGINGAILYRIDDLNLLGELTESTSIHIIKKDGNLAPIPSRVEADTNLKGTKRIIVRQGNVYIGKGRKDDRSIIIIPFISTSPSKSNIIENLLLLNIGFKQNIDSKTREKALGGKYEHIKNIVQENSIPWEDEFLDLLEIDELFGRSAEKIGDFIVFEKKIKSEKP